MLRWWLRKAEAFTKEAVSCIELGLIQALQLPCGWDRAIAGTNELQALIAGCGIGGPLFRGNACDYAAVGVPDGIPAEVAHACWVILAEVGIAASAVRNGGATREQPGDPK